MPLIGLTVNSKVSARGIVDQLYSPETRNTFVVPQSIALRLFVNTDGAQLEVARAYYYVLQVGL